jgi:hypothetical protein
MTPDNRNGDPVGVRAPAPPQPSGTCTPAVIEDMPVKAGRRGVWKRLSPPAF